jgi:hypothetical protein
MDLLYQHNIYPKVKPSLCTRYCCEENLKPYLSPSMSPRTDTRVTGCAQPSQSSQRRRISIGRMTAFHSLFWTAAGHNADMGAYSHPNPSFSRTPDSYSLRSAGSIFGDLWDFPSCPESAIRVARRVSRRHGCSICSRGTAFYCGAFCAWSVRSWMIFLHFMDF